MTFDNKSRYHRTFQQVTHKGGEFAISYIKRFQNAHAARLGNWTFPKNGKQRACKIPNIYGAVDKMPITSYVRYSTQYVCKTDYTRHRTYGTSHNTDKFQSDYIVR